MNSRRESRKRGHLMPRSPGGEGVGIALSVLVHGLLLAALLFGMRWKAPAQQPVTAELWASVPQTAVAAPAPAPEPAPAPPPPAAPAPAKTAPPPRPAAEERQADIALEQARKAREREKAEREKAEKDRADRERAERQKAEREKADREKATREKAEREKADREKAEREKAQRDAKAKAEADRRDKAAADAREAKQREDNLARMMGQLGSASPGGAPAKGPPAAGAGGPSSSYAGRIIAAVKPNIVFAETLTGNPAAEVEVRAGPGGTILGRTLVRSSGVKEWDEAVLRAIDRTGSLPRDVDGSVPSRLTITFRPRD